MFASGHTPCWQPSRTISWRAIFNRLKLSNCFTIRQSFNDFVFSLLPCKHSPSDPRRTLLRVTALVIFLLTSKQILAQLQNNITFENWFSPSWLSLQLDPYSRLPRWLRSWYRLFSTQGSHTILSAPTSLQSSSGIHYPADFILCYGRSLACLAKQNNWGGCYKPFFGVISTAMYYYWKMLHEKWIMLLLEREIRPARLRTSIRIPAQQYAVGMDQLPNCKPVVPFHLSTD